MGKNFTFPAVRERKALTVRHRVVNEDCGLARFSQDSIHRHAKDELKALHSLQLRLSQVIQDGDLKSLHADTRSEVQVTADSHVVSAGCVGQNVIKIRRNAIEASAWECRGRSPSAETGSALRERTVTLAALDRSLPVRHTLTSTCPSLSSTWYFTSPK